MSVNVGQRHVANTMSNTRSKVLQEIGKFEKHTFKITKNKKYFFKEYDDTITLPMLQTIVDVYTDCYVANNIYVSNYNDFVRRYKYQKRAIENMKRVIGYLMIAKEVFHLRLNRYEYWFDLYSKGNEALVNWHKADIKRYGQKFNKI